MALTKTDIVELIAEKNDFKPAEAKKDDHDNFVIFIDRKSRTIMRDAAVILEKANKIRKAVSGATITLETTAPVCSKSTKFLSDNGIEVISKK